MNTTLEFDVTFANWQTTEGSIRMQNNIQSAFSRVRLLYGATPLEDVINYNQIARCLTEWTATNDQGAIDQTSISEGIGGYTLDIDSDGLHYGNQSVRQKYIQGVQIVAAPGAANFTGGHTAGYVGDSVPPQTLGNATATVTRRYQINFGLGLFTQDKLIPTKFMASQLAIEITLEQAAACMFSTNTGTGTSPSYSINNVNLIPEILQFDASYDSIFLAGLRSGGVPLGFSSWHTFIFSSNTSSNVSLLIQERSRSVKALFAVQRRPTSNFFTDNGATFFDTNATGSSTLQTYQYRIGGRYFPAAPVQTSQNGSAVPNGGCEAYVELSKALNIVGDYRLSTNTSVKTWAIKPTSGGRLQEFDYVDSIGSFDATTQCPVVYSTGGSNTNAFCGTLPSANFAMAINLETSNGVEISGLNAEEQSDIALLANWKGVQNMGAASQSVAGGTANVLGLTASNIEVYTYYDAMIVLRENNVLELVQ